MFIIDITEIENYVDMLRMFSLANVIIVEDEDIYHVANGRFPKNIEIIFACTRQKTLSQMFTNV